MDLFRDVREKNLGRVAPLAARMRPATLDEFVGQQHFLGPGKLLRRMLEADRLTSVIFYGPPGTGKTTLARIIAHYTKSHFEQVNAAGVGVKEVRAILDAAKERLSNGGQRTVLFLDEIHRFNRAQQDILLADVEAGQVILVGATTENPFFAVNAPLVSRSQIFQFGAISEEDIRALIRRAISDKERGFGKMAIALDDDALDLWATMSDGDARRALSALEVAVLSGAAEQAQTQAGAESGQRGPGDVGGPEARRSANDAKADDRAKPDHRQSTHHAKSGPHPNPPPGIPGEGTGQIRQNQLPQTPAEGMDQRDRGNHAPAGLPPLHITLDIAEQSMQRKAIVYDGTGDEHYAAASALIKSMRGSDPDAAIYWVARMLEAGEDPRFIARRIAILASEDIGNADPNALLVAAAAYQVVERIGMPEAQLTLGQAAIYMATAPKSNASAMAIWGAMSDVREGRTLPVPRHLRDSHYAGSQRLGHGKDYKYAHDFEGGFVRQEYLGVDKTYYTPTDRGFEAQIAKRMAALREDSTPASANSPGALPGDADSSTMVREQTGGEDTT
ncbi:MAG TPA: replication-associated recombination protein A [Tepidisphaeraceae bacterium]|nr:replication-associated recombination protein A [Tepidisphaeraceae bacterium]